MAAAFSPDQIILSAGQSLSSLYLVLKGRVLATFPGGQLTLEKGDIIGVCEVGCESSQITYTAVTEVSAAAYPFLGWEALETLFQNIPDLASLFAVSVFRQIHKLLEQYAVREYACSGLHGLCMEDYDKYKAVCERHMVRIRPFPVLQELEPFLAEEPPEDWLLPYYEGLRQVFASGAGQALVKQSAAVTGLIGKSAADGEHLLCALKAMYDYECNICQLYMNEELTDYFDMFTALYFKIGQDSPDCTMLLENIRRIMQYLQHTDCADPDFVSVRISDFTNRLASLKQASGVSEEKGETHAAALSGSLDLILEYSGLDPDSSASFRKQLSAFKALADKNAADDASRKLRLTISKLFYLTYSLTFKKSLVDANIPIPVKMFLYFGYMDEELAGADNASYLYSLAGSMESRTDSSVYTLWDWLKAVYMGRKEPSRNEFDQDFGEYLHHLKMTNKLSETQMKEQLRDPVKKVEFELENMFPLVNKMTFGRISTFFPIFSEHNILKPLSSCYVSTASIGETLGRIRELDYSAFYREVIYSNEAIGVPKEYIHTECLPDFILMPNIGSRGVMWQEIEGKKRTTPSRMMLSVFELEDLYSTVVRITGEYRWEMCKRIQGPRWNDVTNRSLTSEYCDYVQFYKKSHDLSADAKDKVKASLQKAKNSFKEMFIRDYILWIFFEGSGSPRLNKVARTILFTYCPFSAAVRSTLATNPAYKELTDHHQLKQGQRSHHLDNVAQKITNSGNPLPEEIIQERNYTER